MVVEIVDTLEKIEKFLPALDTLLVEGLVTLERVKVIRHGKQLNHTLNRK
jgi:hypothetical protein